MVNAKFHNLMIKKLIKKYTMTMQHTLLFYNDICTRNIVKIRLIHYRNNNYENMFSYYDIITWSDYIHWCTSLAVF